MAIDYFLSDNIEEIVLANAVLSYTTPSITSKQFHELKTGQASWETKLDLTGLTTEAARESLIRFFKKNQEKNLTQCVLIVHGLERTKNAPPLLKNCINHWLPQFPEVAAFHSAQAKDGGPGAVYVLLRKEIHPPKPIQGEPERTTFLVSETKAMERRRRLAEQQGERQLAPVKAREHSDQEPQSGPEGELQNSILQHPQLDSQRFDGIDPNLNPEPPLNTDARREFDNEKREQDQEKQLRLGNMPKFTTAPTPRGP
jgi:DNA-nicking Smr family endonuclease